MSDKPEAGPKCSKCQRKMQKSTLKPGKVYCSWCREYTDAP